MSPAEFHPFYAGFSTLNKTSNRANASRSLVRSDVKIVIFNDTPGLSFINIDSLKSQDK